MIIHSLANTNKIALASQKSSRRIKSSMNGLTTIASATWLKDLMRAIGFPLPKTFHPQSFLPVRACLRN
jgi:hypothetical protein